MEKRKIEVTCEIEVVKMSDLLDYLMTLEQCREITYEGEIDRIKLIAQCLVPTNWSNIYKLKKDRIGIYLQNAGVFLARGMTTEKIKNEAKFYDFFSSVTFLMNLDYIELDI